MPRQIENITDEPYQQHTVLIEEEEAVLTLRFLPRVQAWSMDIEHPDWNMYGIRLSVGARMTQSAGRDFDFVCRDKSENRIDPFRVDDFATDRCRLYLLEPDDVLNIALGEPIS